MATPKIPKKKVVPKRQPIPKSKVQDRVTRMGRSKITRTLSKTTKTASNLAKTKTAGALMSGQIQGSRLKGSIRNLVNNPKLKSIINKVKTSTPKVTNSLKNLLIDSERLANNIKAKHGPLGRLRSVKAGNILIAVSTISQMQDKYKEYRKIGYTHKEALIKTGFVEGTGLAGGLLGAEVGGKLAGIAGLKTGFAIGGPVGSAILAPTAGITGRVLGYQGGDFAGERSGGWLYDRLSGTTEQSIALRRAKGLVSETPGIKGFDTLTEKQKQSPAYKEIQRLKNLGVTSSAEDNPTKTVEKQPVVTTKGDNNNKTSVIRNNVQSTPNIKVKPGDKLAMATKSKKSNVFTKHYKTGKELGVMTRNQRKNYEKEAAGREWKGGGGTKFVGENSTWIDRNNNVIAPKQKQEAIA